jgi:pimeloyl-ACP methyl ester carboxylesterase
MVGEGLRSYRRRAADGVEIGVHRVGPGGAGSVPVVLLAGTFSSRNFWLGSRGQGLAHVLAEVGFEPWIIEPRGRGESGRPPSWTLDDWIRLDVPAALDVVREEGGSDGYFWIGHSAGGVVGAAFAGSGLPAASALKGMVLLGSPGPGGLAGWRRLGAWACYLASGAVPTAHFSGRRLRLGPEREPARLVRDWLGWNLAGRWRGATGRDYLAALPAVGIPVLAVAGSADRMLAPPAAVADLLARFGSPDRTLIVAGRSTGFSVDFNHPGLVIGSPAAREIWPRLIEWLEARRPKPAGK